MAEVLFLRQVQQNPVGLRAGRPLKGFWHWLMDKGEMTFCISDPCTLEEISAGYQQALKISDISQHCGMIAHARPEKNKLPIKSRSFAPVYL